MLLLIVVYFGVIWKFFYTSCYVVELTGFPCPACGLTRAGFAVLRGHFHDACQLHIFIYPIIGMAIVAIVKRYFLKQDLKILKKYLVMLLILMVIYYIYRMIRFFPGDPPMSFYNNNLLRRILFLYQN